MSVVEYARRLVTLPGFYREVRDGGVGGVGALLAAIALTITFGAVVMRGDTVARVYVATGGLVGGTWLVSGFGLFAVATAIRFAGLQASDVGLVGGTIRRGLLFTLVAWCLAQLVLAIAALATLGELRLHAHWTNPPTVLIGSLAGQMLGIALLEELCFRGVLVPQLYRRFRGLGEAGAIAIAVLVSAAMFAAVHVPIRLAQDVAGAALVIDLGSLARNGILYALVYLRTRELGVLIGLHALGNEPMTLIESPVAPGAVHNALLWCVVLIRPLREPKS